MLVSAADVEACRDICVQYATSVAHLDWTSAIPGLEHTVASLVAHQAQVMSWYTLDLAARGAEVAATAPTVDASGSPTPR